MVTSTDCSSDTSGTHSIGAKSEGCCLPAARKDDGLVSQVEEEIRRRPESTLSMVR